MSSSKASAQTLRRYLGALLAFGFGATWWSFIPAAQASVLTTPRPIAAHRESIAPRHISCIAHVEAPPPPPPVVRHVRHVVIIPMPVTDNQIPRDSVPDVTPDVTVTPDITPGITPDITPDVTPDLTPYLPPIRTRSS